MTFGVVYEGFNSKKLADVLADIEARNAQADRFGPDVIQTAQSPLGQINGTAAEISVAAWETALGVYNANDPDQTEGPGLDRIGKIRGVERGGREDFQFQRAITNRDVPDIHLRPLYNEVFAQLGVEFVHVFENATAAQDDNGLSPHSLAISVIGGDDGSVAQAIYNYTVSGIGLWGNTFVAINDGRHCRTVGFLRLSFVDVEMTVVISDKPTGDCSVPSVDQVRNAIYDTLNYTNDECGYVNGDTPERDDIVKALASLNGARLANVYFQYSLDEFASRIDNTNFRVAFDQIVRLDKARIAVVYE